MVQWKGTELLPRLMQIRVLLDVPNNMPMSWRNHGKVYEAFSSQFDSEHRHQNLCPYSEIDIIIVFETIDAGAHPAGDTKKLRKELFLFVEH